jgi:hypothetical protein
MIMSLLTKVIDDHLSNYCGVGVKLSSAPFICSVPDSFLLQHCSEVVNLPAAFIALDLEDEAFLAIHLSDFVRERIVSAKDTPQLISTRDGLDSLLILIEEISHFHHYVECASDQMTISRFDLELQAELEKVAVCSLITSEIFGRSYIVELIKIIYNESLIHSDLTDYGRVSRIAERFWKHHLTKYGPMLLNDHLFRKNFKKFAQSMGTSKHDLLDKMTAA